MRKIRTGILISGRGSNMGALIEAARAEDYPAEITCVISNIPDAPGLAVAAAAGIATRVVDHRAHPGKPAFEKALLAALAEFGVEVIALAGFMRVLSADFIARHEGRILNIHPSLLPQFKGLDTHARALAAGVKEHGCSVHLVTAELDDGPILAQARVPVLPGDDEKSLARRVLAEEHRIYPQAFGNFCGKLLKSQS